MLSAASLAITVAMIVVAITIQRNLSASNLQLGATEYLPHNAIAGRINQITLVLAAGLVILAAINAIFITWATIIDSRRPAALARAFGATPRQVSAGLSAAQLVPALAAGLLGIPAGLGLFAAVITAVSTGSTPIVLPPAWSLAAVTLGTLIVVAGLAAIPARIGARQPVAQALRADQNQ